SVCLQVPVRISLRCGCGNLHPLLLAEHNRTPLARGPAVGDALNRCRVTEWELLEPVAYVSIEVLIAAWRAGVQRGVVANKHAHREDGQVLRAADKQHSTHPALEAAQFFGR